MTFIVEKWQCDVHQFPTLVVFAICMAGMAWASRSEIRFDRARKEAALSGERAGGTVSQIISRGSVSILSHNPVTGEDPHEAHHESERQSFSGQVASEPVADENEAEPARTGGATGSPYVPLDSWIYPALERLAARGYVRTAFLGLRPWTRKECARLLREAGESIDTTGDDSGMTHLYLALVDEFADETSRKRGQAKVGVTLDSVYSGFMEISGIPLRDGYHFGQTLINDYGRPYSEGFNATDGFTGHAEAGPLSVALQGEYQHAPAVLSNAASVLQATAAADATLPLANGTPAINRLRLLESTIALAVGKVEFSFGRQSLWLGPSAAGPFLFSNNAEPVAMLRIDSATPYRIPWVSRVLGPVRSQFFLGRLSGQRWEASPTLSGPNLASQPFLHGTSVSFRPTENLEFGMGFTAQLGGPGNPFTWSDFLRTFYSHRAGLSDDPAKRLSEFNFNYRVPGLRRWLQVYTDSMVIDEYSPIGSSRPAINPGLYFSQLPKLPKVEVRVEGVTTDLNWPAHFPPGAVYYDGRYRSGYTNNGNLIGSWIGRQGRGEQGWVTYRSSVRTFIQAEYRHNSVDREFLQGGQTREFTLRADVTLSKKWSLSGFVQQEKWHFPVLASTSRSDVAASLRLTFWPRWKTPQESTRTSPQGGRDRSLP